MLGIEYLISHPLIPRKKNTELVTVQIHQVSNFIGSVIHLLVSLWTELKSHVSCVRKPLVFTHGLLTRGTTKLPTKMEKPPLTDTW